MKIFLNKISLSFLMILSFFVANAQTITRTGAALPGTNPTVTVTPVLGCTYSGGTVTCDGTGRTIVIDVQVSGLHWSEGSVSPYTGAGTSWIHGVSLATAGAWEALGTGSGPANWVYQAAGCRGDCNTGTTYGAGFYYEGSGTDCASDNATNPCDNYGVDIPNASRPTTNIGPFTWRLTICPSPAATLPPLTLNMTSDADSGGDNVSGSATGTVTITFNQAACQTIAAGTVAQTANTSPNAATLSGGAYSNYVCYGASIGAGYTANGYPTSLGGGTLLGASHAISTFTAANFDPYTQYIEDFYSTMTIPNDGSNTNFLPNPSGFYYYKDATYTGYNAGPPVDSNYPWYSDCDGDGNELSFKFLNNITSTLVSTVCTDSDADGFANYVTVTFKVNGGLPEAVPAELFTLSNIGGAMTNLSTTTPAHNTDFTFRLPVAGGAYSFDVVDALGCTRATISGTTTPPSACATCNPNGGMWTN